jgi:hypothetical protein
VNDKNIVITVNAYLYRDVATKMLVANGEHQRQTPTPSTNGADAGQRSANDNTAADVRRQTAERQGALDCSSYLNLVLNPVQVSCKLIDQ